MTHSPDLPARLRRQTAGLHNRTEIAVGFPASISTLGDYGAALQRLLAYHLTAEDSLNQPGWTTQWGDFGIDLDDHRRSVLLTEDLLALGYAASVERMSLAIPADFGGALGYLWVLEGSALGGRALSPAIQTAVGSVSTRFFDSYGRDHPRPWRRTQDALRQYSDGGGDPELVETGAHSMFAGYARYLASTGWSGKS